MQGIRNVSYSMGNDVEPPENGDIVAYENVEDEVKPADVEGAVVVSSQEVESTFRIPVAANLTSGIGVSISSTRGLGPRKLTVYRGKVFLLWVY